MPPPPFFHSASHVDACRPQCCQPSGATDGGWGIFNAILGWTNSATYGSVISYNVYWIFVMAMFVTLRYHEIKGHWPLCKAKPAAGPAETGSQSESHAGRAADSKTAAQQKTTAASA